MDHRSRIRYRIGIFAPYNSPSVTMNKWPSTIRNVAPAFAKSVHLRGIRKRILVPAQHTSRVLNLIQFQAFSDRGTACDVTLTLWKNDFRNDSIFLALFLSRTDRSSTFWFAKPVVLSDNERVWAAFDKCCSPGWILTPDLYFARYLPEKAA